MPSLGLPAPPPGFGVGAVFNGEFDNAPSSLPPAPPRAARSTDPFSKENRRATLLDIGSAFLSNPDFFQGLGEAGQAVRGRMDELKRKNPKVAYGGPGDRFEISEDPDTGERTIREVPEFRQAYEDERNRDLAEAKAKGGLKADDIIDLRARAFYAIGQLPPEQRAAAYADLMTNPSKYALPPEVLAGAPSEWSDQYGSVAGQLGVTVNQNRNYTHRQERDVVKDKQWQMKFNKPPAGRGGSVRYTTKAETGYSWE